MKNQKMYEADDKMISLIRDNYDLLQSLGSFGISLGFGDKTVQETCEDNNVDTYTFLAVVNFTANGYGEFDADEKISVPTLLHYLEACHAYFLDFQLPYIRRELTESLNENDSLARLILRFYDEYAREIRLHMKYEQKTLFPYVESLLEGHPANDYNVETFSKHHGATDKKLRELKLLIIKYLPQDGLHNNQLTATLHDIYENYQIWSSKALSAKTPKPSQTVRRTSSLRLFRACRTRKSPTISASPLILSSPIAAILPASYRFTVRQALPSMPSSTDWWTSLRSRFDITSSFP